jgi:DNA ligase (NAD+)
MQALVQDPRVLAELDVAQLEAIVHEADEAYFNGTECPLDDRLYDATRRRLTELWPDSDVLKGVGAAVRRGKTALPVYMGSLDKKVDDAALMRWQLSHPGPYAVSDKLDGVSGLLEVDARGRRRLLTRGDSTHGEDVSFLLGDLQGIPKALPSGTLVRGEVIISRESGKRLRAGGLAFKNLRALVAGTVNSVRLRRPEVMRHIEFVPYALLTPEGLTQLEQFTRLAGMGFKRIWYRVMGADAGAGLRWQWTLDDILAERKLHGLYDVDGVVIADYLTAPGPPVPGKNPAHIVAFKSPGAQETAETTVLRVEWVVSKDGLFKPTVHFDPVVLGGAVIARASGQNARFVHESGIGPGARLVVVRSGDVIPYIVEVKASAPGGAMMPPDGEWAWNASGADAVATGGAGAEALRVKAMEHFFTTVGARGVSTKTVARLFDAGFDTPEAVIAATPNELAHRAGLGPKAAENVAGAVRDAMAAADEVTLLMARNVFGRGIGEKRLRAVLEAVPDLMRRRAGDPALPGLLRAVPGMAAKTVQQILGVLEK